ncbi:MAG: NYN domain-containing protein [Nanoarchaeota archaeon]
MEKAVFFIDRGYLSFISKYFGKGKPLRNKIEKFAKNIANTKSLEIEEIYFYTAPPYKSPIQTTEENKRRANYDNFIKKLKEVSNPKINIREGRVQKVEGGFQQKGVDTLFTMDLFKISQKSKIQNLIILTSDTDFVPIIEEIRRDFRVKVILAYFTDKKRKSAFSLSNHLWNICDDKIFIKKEYFED